DYIYLVIKNIYLIEKKDKLHSEQISIIIGKNFIITFLEKDGIFLKNIYEKLENEKSRLRKSGIDFLAYSLIDNFVDNYFDIIENIGEKIEYLEEKLVKNPSQALLQKIHAIKKDMIFIRKTVWPLREVINLLERGEIGSISDNTRIYLRDVYDHIIQIVDIIETYRDIVSGMIDIYLSSISNRLNEVMKVLTIISTIFIPLTFITGIYGMNFRFMPEIDYKFGYFIVIGVCLIVVIVMLLYFKRKKWL
ncbi:MAG TPA: magnesium and cobalt transport protein CorA, partial [Actinobacteria bacterium]|nr:magnesium and cobalt transport protein CorA [Actinomycetota bacterium]